MKRFNTKTQLVRYFLKGCIGFFILGIIFAALVALFDMINPKIISFAVDSVIGDKAGELPFGLNSIVTRLGGVSELRAHPYWIAIMIAIIAGLGGVCRYLFRRSNAEGAERLVKRMRDKLFSHIMKLPYTWLGENSTGDIIQRCTSDVDTIKRFLSEQMTLLIRVIILIAMSLAFMISISPLLTLIAAAFIPVIIGYSVYFHRHIASAFEKADVQEGKLSTIAQENLTGVRVVRAFGREKYEKERFEKQNIEYTGFWIHLMRLLSLFWSTGDVMSGLQVLLVTVLGAVFCVNGQITAGQYIAFVSYNTMLRWPVR
ncbi:MAG: ABC transporter ATP-binding protein, partial [Lachnospiraceae bacterium]|nr:ABC transporter ATP-binding protein [Lachnospiraceae bacterium]